MYFQLYSVGSFQCDVAFVIEKFLATFLGKHYGINEIKLIILPNFANNADVELFSAYAYVISGYFAQHVFF